MEKPTVRMVASVPVATVWTTPASPREMDRPAIENPADLTGWLQAMSYEDRLELCEANLVQTQVLYGSLVEVIEEEAGWLKVVIPSQPSKKDERGYPGWMPKCQLLEASGFAANPDQPTAVVTSTAARLYDKEGEPGITLSFLTRLPVISQSGEWIEVTTPAGPQLLKQSDVAVFLTERDIPIGTGKQIVEAGKQFLGLPYLWGGMSSFGYDCSGFAYNMHLANGIIIPRDASDQAKQGKAVERQDLQPGDLLFFAYEEGKGAVHHVGIYAGDDQMLHSPKTGKTIELLPLSGSAYEVELCAARRYW
ncbi:NlpC/P60 family protein [Brevibacillus sp. B_LB10_24]|uniref:C40 family peptidase n=1 Tax=Brevibacillus sp. B_LB10_24 TaxID=3380645 RepID=UPI0038B870EA